jgi:hypothetical protein
VVYLHMQTHTSTAPTPAAQCTSCHHAIFDYCCCCCRCSCYRPNKSAITLLTNRMPDSDLPQPQPFLVWMPGENILDCSVLHMHVVTMGKLYIILQLPLSYMHQATGRQGPSVKLLCTVMNNSMHDYLAPFPQFHEHIKRNTCAPYNGLYIDDDVSSCCQSSTSGRRGGDNL